MSEPVGFEEYEAAFRRFIACLKQAGVGVVDQGFDPEHRRFLYTTAGDDEFESSTGTTPDTACYEREFLEVDKRWQFQVEAEGTAFQA